MLSRTVKRALLDPRYHLPPTFLLPWTAGITTNTSSADANAVNSIPPHLISTSTKPSLPQAELPQAVQKKSSPLALSESVRELLPALRAQRQIYITLHIHGKAYLLRQGDTLRLPFFMKDVEPGDILRLNRALYLGSRDYTLKPGAAPPKLRVGYEQVQSDPNAAQVATVTPEEFSAAQEPVAPHFIPHIAKGKHAYLDERLFLCRALVMGVESEPLRVMEKTKRRQRHVKHVKSKHRYTILKIKDLQVRSLQQIEDGELE